MKHLEPKEAWAYIGEHPDTLFIDVRMEIEYLYVGHPPKVRHIPWYEYPELEAHPERFIEQVRHEAKGLDRPVMLICRSGQRTVDAGKALEAAGFTTVINVLHGFEGSLDPKFHRGTVNGWRFDGLPWQQM